VTSPDELDYDLPDAAIAQEPIEPRDSARLLVDTGPDTRPDHRTVADLPSLVDNDGILVSVALLGSFAKVYAPEPADARNPLAWPHFATVEDLTGLPPHAISLYELDPLRDEGLAYFHKLLAAGVPAQCRTLNGIFHAAENNYFGAIPDVARSTLRDIVGFACSL
jgi:acetyl esterase/lipase